MSTSLRTFQTNAVERGVGLVQETLANEGRAALSIEAPTGTGKTLMVGHMASRLTENNRIVWFWIAPFDGLVQQAERVIRSEFPRLRLRDIRTERRAENASTGDTYVLTWALTTNIKSEVNTGSENGVALDAFCRQLKAAGFRIGMVVDEAHYGLKEKTKALEVFSTKINPDIALLVSATPKDKTMQTLLEAGHLGNQVNRISVSRQEGVEARLLKPDIVSVIIKADIGSEISDTAQVALKLAVKCHRDLKQQMIDQQLGMTPLLLIQADSERDSIEKVRGFLKDEGFTDQQVVVHTAAEPSEDLLVSAVDDTIEVLVFKMAVATGFDAPRASTLCSLRAIRDADFGMQIVGRIARIDRRMQGRNDLPENLELGYVFLATPGKQAGLQAAAKRIEEMQSEYEKHVGSTHVLSAQQATAALSGPVRAPWSAPAAQSQNPLDAVADSQTPALVSGERVYPLNTALGVPSHLKTVETDPSRIHDLELSAVNNLRIDGDTLLAITRTNQEIQLRSERIYAEQYVETQKAEALMSEGQIKDTAARMLEKMPEGKGRIDLGELEVQLRQRIKREMQAKGMKAPDDAELNLYTKHFIVLRNREIRDAVANATQDRRSAVPTKEPLPTVLTSRRRLVPATKNIYGVYPEMNPWEKKLAEDLEAADEVVWWHRNEPQKPWSVSLPLDGGKRYYPDFVVCVRGRKSEGGIILLEPKERVNDIEGLAARKILTEHPAYGFSMMLYLERATTWKVVEREDGQNRTTRPFQLPLLVTWGWSL